MSDIFSHTVLRLPYELQNDDPWIRFITTQEQWESFYTELLSQNLGGDDLDSPIAVPEIDFTRYEKFFLLQSETPIYFKA